MAGRSNGFEPVVAVERVMRAYPEPWFMSGGWAIDLFVGRVTREHEDVEVGAFFPHQETMWRHLGEWRLLVPVDGQWVSKGPPRIELPEFQVKARPKHAEPGPDGSDLPEFDVFLNPLDGSDWVSRRHDGLRVPAGSIARRRTIGGGGDRRSIPYLRPEIQLLYKAKGHRPKDDADFDVALPHLSLRARRWLSRALERYHPGDPWLERLTEASA